MYQLTQLSGFKLGNGISLNLVFNFASLFRPNRPKKDKCARSFHHSSSNQFLKSLFMTFFNAKHCNLEELSVNIHTKWMDMNWRE